MCELPTFPSNFTGMNPIDLIHRVGPGGRMLLFVKAVCVSLMAAPTASPTHLATKCAPILALILMVQMHRKSLPEDCHKERKYCQLVSWALGMSAAGDAALVCPQPAALPIGMALFGVAHAIYCTAMGWTPLNLKHAAICFVLNLVGASYLAPTNWLQIPVIIYSLMLSTMLWRATVKGPPASIAGILFIISDGIISYTMFIEPLPYQRLLIMSTYYSAQLLFAMSALTKPIVINSEAVKPHAE